MKRTFQLIGLSGILVYSIVGYTQVPLPPNSAHIRSEIEREQAQRLKDIQAAKRGVQQLESPQTLPQSTLVQDPQCFPIQKVSFSGNTVFSQEQLLAWIHFKPACVGLSQINEYLRLITNKYVAGGYITSRAFLIPQDLTVGELKILILEGKLEGLHFNGKPQGFLNNAFPHLVGKILNLRDIEQGLDQINRLSRYNAQIKLLPGTKTGFSIVDIRTKTGRWNNMSFGFNNSGQKSTGGEAQLAYTLGAENIFDALDQWSLSGSRSSAWRTHDDSESLSLNVDIPRGAWNVAYRTTYSSYQNAFLSNNMTFYTAGQTNSHDLTVKWLFHRDAISKSSLTGGVNHRREKNYLGDNLLTTSSRQLSSAFLSFDYSSQLGRGFFILSPRLTLGTDWFGGESDRGKSAGAPQAQFYKGTLTTSYTYPVNQALSLTSTVFGQWSNDKLYGSQQVSIGGEYSVRGFKTVSISGNEGYYWRNDLTYQLGQLPHLGHLQVQWALDTGSIVKDKQEQFERGSLMGTSVSFSTRSKQISNRLSVGIPLAAPGRLAADNYVIYYQLNVAV